MIKLKNKISNAFYIVLVAVFFLIGCEKVNVPTNNTGYIIVEGYPPVKTVEIEGCKYFIFTGNSRMGLTHKGNCDNIVHKPNCN